MINILLVCNAGMSTSILVNKMKTYAQQQNIDAKINAISSANLNDEMAKGNIDVILLGPQVKYLKKQIDDDYQHLNIPVEAIPMLDYGTMNGEKVLRFAQSLIEK